LTDDELSRLTAEKEKKVRDRIDDYVDTVFAILGFCSLWSFDPVTRSNRPEVRTFQGRHLSRASTEQEDDVTPDLGIAIGTRVGIIGEVKKNFPRDGNSRKEDIFKQLKTYDQELIGWPTDDEKITGHEIALLVHQTTYRSACDYYGQVKAEEEAKFTHNFGIFQFNRSDQRVPYFFFQLCDGKIDELLGNTDIYNGVQVPMTALLSMYSRSKLYDAEPPAPYLADLIWESVIAQIASEDERYPRLRRNQKIEVSISVAEIADKLWEGFSFAHWHMEYPSRQPKTPRIEWVRNACQFMVEIKEAVWNKQDYDLVVNYRKLDAPLEHFIHLHAEMEARQTLQPDMFSEAHLAGDVE